MTTVTAELVAIVLSVGSVLPLLTAVLQRPHWSDRARTVIGVLLSVLAGAATYLATEGLDVSSPSRIVGVIVGVVLAAASSYKTVWKPSGIAPAIERATTPKVAEDGEPDYDDVEEPHGLDAGGDAPADDGEIPEDEPEGLDEPESFDDGTGPGTGPGR